MFYDQFEKLCRASNISPTKVLADLNLSKGSLSNWKKGATPNGDIILRFSEFFNVSTDYLLGVSDDPTPPDMQKPTPETVGPALEAMLRAHGYLQNDQPLTDEEADEILRITKAVWEARRPPKKPSS